MTLPTEARHSSHREASLLDEVCRREIAMQHDGTPQFEDCALGPVELRRHTAESVMLSAHAGWTRV